MRARKRLFGGGCKPHFPVVEKGLDDWICEVRSKKHGVSIRQAQNKALQLHQRNGTQKSFKACRGWISGYLRRFHKSLRRRTHKATQNKKTKEATCNALMEHITVMNQLARIYSTDRL